MSEVIRATDKDGVKLVFYRDNYELQAHKEGNDGTYYQQWSKPQIGRDKFADKAIPVKIVIGPKETAAGVLLSLLQEITGCEYVPSGEPRTRQELPDDDVPF